MEEFENVEESQEIKRPLRLTVLCILTFVFSGLASLSSLVTPFFADSMTKLIKESPGYTDELYGESIVVINAGWAYHFPTLVFTLGSLTGAILMWNLKKTGFHFYAISNLALLFIPTFALGMTMSWPPIFVTISFIGMYGLNFKSLK